MGHIEKTGQNFPADLADVVDRWQLTARQSLILEQRLLGVPNNLIAEIVGCGTSTLYRELANPKLDKAMTELMSLALKENTVSASQAVQSALDLVNQTIISDTVPIPLRLEASRIIFDAYGKLSSSQREQTIIDMFIAQSQPQAVEPMNPTENAFKVNE